ncbi:uncharacterized protein BXZ73DRAFT_98842 [Epithele typhae]|uniref:uncharacterized protein n=1 Tax=Epithele typhae TaxID=378194 RepID=UPI002007389C|nr:uncharacterized protein BXZ73DRAFT_98842 [Epithele typhae]KAH9940406.1 hypothetical protein BXZ73DRAFT_98842 [Epithele typhae]
MGLKRKFSLEFDDVAPTNGKQAKLLPFPTMDLDSDVAMSDGSLSDLDALLIPTFPAHTRHQSDVSYASSATSDSPRHSPFYPALEIYPGDQDSEMGIAAHGHPDPSPNAPQKPIGLIQPSGNGFSHHGHNCTQIPKLRMACSSGPNGRRSMWALCEECGAIEIVDSD